MYYYNPYGMYWPQGAVDSRNNKDICIKFMNFYVVGHLNDGSQIEGIIEDVDDDEVTMLVPEEVDEAEVDGDRQIGVYGGFGGGGYGGFGGYGGYGGYGRRRYRRFRRRRFPHNVFVFPFVFPFPFYY